MTFLHSVLILSTVCFANVFSGEIITSPPITDWGEWNALQSCPEGTFAKGFQLLTHPSQGLFSDDTALNGVKLFCGYPTAVDTVNITSGVGVHGEWGRTFSCGGGYIYGFQLRVEQNGVDDETATGNVRFFCTNAEPEVFVEGDGTEWGEWRDVMKCARTQALCAISTQLEPDSGSGITHDDTAMNNLSAECCDLPPPPTTAPPTTAPPTTEAPATSVPL